MGHYRLSVLNDNHVGTFRTAGTTPATAYQLRQFLLADFGRLLGEVDNDLLINGDLFDKEIIPLSDVLDTFQRLSRWLTEKGHRLILSAGNHDLSKNSANLSSFQFLCKLLTSVSSKVLVVSDLTEIHPGYWVLPHLANQDLLDNRLAKVPECVALFVHTNYDNNFAAQSDHSLNISREQAEKIPAQFIVFGHEHQTKTALAGKVIIPGNQTPSSIADCLGTTENAKFMVEVADGAYTLRKVCELSYVEMDWQQLDPTNESQFIRITGEASSEQGAQVAQAISRFRAKSPALVLGNAVAIRGADGVAQSFERTLQEVKVFNVMAALKEQLNEVECKALEELGYV